MFVVMLHSVPVVWLTPVVAGTAPAIALLGYGFASVLTFDREGVALGLFALLPGLVYAALAWGLAWLLAKLAHRASRVVRAGFIATLESRPEHFQPLQMVGVSLRQARMKLEAQSRDTVAGR